MELVGNFVVTLNPLLEDLHNVGVTQPFIHFFKSDTTLWLLLSLFYGILMAISTSLYLVASITLLFFTSSLVKVEQVAPLFIYVHKTIGVSTSFSLAMC
jgi:hypothetical protein